LTLRKYFFLEEESGSHFFYTLELQKVKRLAGAGKTIILILLISNQFNLIDFDSIKLK